MHILSLEPATGRARRILRPDIPPADLQRAGAILARALAVAGGRIAARVAPADSIELDLTHCAARGMRASVRVHGEPVADLAVALHSRVGAALWRALHVDHSGEIRGRADNPPAAPWCAIAPCARADAPMRTGAAPTGAHGSPIERAPPATVEIRQVLHRGNTAEFGDPETAELIRRMVPALAFAFADLAAQRRASTPPP